MPLEDALPWLEKAAEDLKVVIALEGHRVGLGMPICFHCQQAAEKALKAVIAADHVVPPKTHDIASLVRTLAARGNILDARLRAPAYSLTSYAIDLRYPGIAFGPDEADIQEAISAASSVVRWALGQLGAQASSVGLEILDNEILREARS